MTGSSFEGYPNGAHHESCGEAVSILRSAHGTASYLAEVFDYLKMQVEAADDTAQAGFAAQNEELLRAMLIFAGSGLDAMIKQLVQDALPDVINLRTGAQEQFRPFVEKRLKRGDGPDYSFVAGVIADPDPRSHLVGDLMARLTEESMYASMSGCCGPHSSRSRAVSVRTRLTASGIGAPRRIRSRPAASSMISPRARRTSSSADPFLTNSTTSAMLARTA